jgi:hypothetical protein
MPSFMATYTAWETQCLMSNCSNCAGEAWILDELSPIVILYRIECQKQLVKCPAFDGRRLRPFFVNPVGLDDLIVPFLSDEEAARGSHYGRLSIRTPNTPRCLTSTSSGHSGLLVAADGFRCAVGDP